MKVIKRLVPGALMMLALGAVGCGTETGSPEVTEATTEGRLLASLQLSETHKVDFFEYADGDLSVKESLNVDKDLGDGHPTLARMNTTGVKTADIYKSLAGTRFESKIAAVLGGADARNLALAAQFKARSADQLGADQLDQAQFGTEARNHALAETPVATTGDTQTVTSAATCAEPAWDWVADVGWFKNNFCGANSKFCPTEWSSAYYGKRGPTDFKATGFAQSHCSSAHWYFKRTSYGGFPFYGIAEKVLADTHLAPRTLATEHWTTTGDRKYYASISADAGNNRIALAIHHN
jgi:hypothetical protein